MSGKVIAVGCRVAIAMALGGFVRSAMAVDQIVNPIGTGDSADPCVVYDHDLHYYYLLFTRGVEVRIFRSRHLATLRHGESCVAYSVAEHSGSNPQPIFRPIWAPEMHKAPDGKWYIYTCGAIAPNTQWGQKRLLVLESKTSDPFDGFTYRGKLDNDLFAIDPTMLTHDGKQYICYSQVKHERGQVLVIREMETPLKMGKREAEIAHAELPWELKNYKINEGAFFIRSPNGKRLFCVYSGNGCWCDDYALAVVEFTGGDLCDAKNWKKHPEPILVKGNGMFGPGHASFFRSPDSKELWCAYHAFSPSNPKLTPITRRLCVQRVNFTDDGYPVMGRAIGSAPQDPPSGEGFWAAKWIGSAPETRPDEDMGDAQWITAPADGKGTVTLEYAFDCPKLADDAVVDVVHAGVDIHEIEVNGKSFYLHSGHIHDPRQALFQNLRQWLKEGRNTMKVKVSGAGEKHFIAKIIMPDGTRHLSGSGWTSPNGAVKTLGKVRDTEFGKQLKLRTETVSPAFAKRFTVAVDKQLKKAELRVTGVGFYEARLNGRKVGDKVLDPSPSVYHRHVLYSVYDVTGQIRTGENDLRILLGHGWYDNRAVATWNFEISPWRDFPRTIAQLELTYADGTAEIVGTDKTWRQVANPVIYDDIYEGEVVDGRIGQGKREGNVGAWDDKNYFDGKRLFAAEVEGPQGALAEELQPGAKVMDEIRAKAVHPLGADSCMIEFPVDLSGWMRLKLSGQRSGDVVSFRYDERANPDMTPAQHSVRDGIHNQLPKKPLEGRHVDEHFRYPASHRFCAKDAAFQCDRYICRGEDGETYEPRFSYKGFRYVYVRGLRRMPKAEDVVACFVHTGFKTIGSFACSDATFNQLMAMGERAYKCNFADGVPTDCPHREKNGWTGDASIASELAQYLFENTAGYRKWLTDIMDSQLPDGNIPGIVPTSGWGFAWGNGPGWDSALPVIAWNLWIYRGDRAILERTYPALKKYLAYTATKANSKGLVKHGLGDWVPVNRKHMPAFEFTSSCYYYQAMRIAVEMAKVLGETGDVDRYAALAEKTRKGLRETFMKPDGVWENGGQTAQGMALAFGLVNDNEREAAERQLVAAFERQGCHVDMGIFGMKHSLRALSRAGRTDVAFKMLVNPTRPSPAEWLHKGGTTLWEDWGDGTSRNHIMFGDFVGWAYQYLAGIRMEEAAGSTSAVTIPTATAFKRVVIEPIFLKELNSLNASTETAAGKVGVSWLRKGAKIEVTVTIPAGTEAEIRLPKRPPEKCGVGVKVIEIEG